MSFPTKVAAAEKAYVFLNSGAMLRAASPGLKLVGTLRMGSFVEIPDRFILKDEAGKVDLERSVNLWLQTSQVELPLSERVHKLKSGREIKHYFPVKIAHAEFGSVVPADVQTPLIALEDLRRAGRVMVVTKDSELFQKEYGQDSSIPVHKDSCSETKVLADLQIDLGNILEAVDQRVFRNALNQKELTDLQKPLKTCRMDSKKFVEEIQAAVNSPENLLDDGSRIPPEILLSILQLESFDSRGCTALRKESDGSYSVGLFQINTGSSRKTIQQLKDPLTNLKEAIRILKAKYNGVINDPDWRVGQTEAERKEKLDAELVWKLALAAYNGGEGNLDRIRNDVLRFNARHGTQLSVRNWEDLRLFFFRAELRGQGKELKYMGAKGYARNPKMAKINLEYAESIIGRTLVQRGWQDLPKSPSLASKWRIALIPVPNPSE